jgi:hypothetical protein
MRRTSRFLITLPLASALALPVLISGCAGHGRVYDPDHHDYHTWDHGEVAYYNRWEAETHREHREITDRPAAEQKEYWDWRHNQH